MLREGKDSNSTARWGTRHKTSTCDKGTQLSTCVLGSLFPLCKLLPIFIVHFNLGGFFNDVHLFLNEGRKICWSNGQVLNAKTLLANNEMLNANKPTVHAILPERDRLILIFPKIQGKLIKEISSVCPSHIFTSVTYLLTARWQNSNRNSARLMSGKRMLNVSQRECSPLKLQQEEKKLTTGLGSWRVLAGYRDMKISCGSRHTNLDFPSEILNYQFSYLDTSVESALWPVCDENLTPIE